MFGKKIMKKSKPKSILRLLCLIAGISLFVWLTIQEFHSFFVDDKGIEYFKSNPNMLLTSAVIGIFVGLFIHCILELKKNKKRSIISLIIIILTGTILVLIIYNMQFSVRARKTIYINRWVERFQKLNKPEEIDLYKSPNGGVSIYRYFNVGKKLEWVAVAYNSSHSKWNFDAVVISDSTGSIYVDDTSHICGGLSMSPVLLTKTLDEFYKEMDQLKLKKINTEQKGSSRQ